MLTGNPNYRPDIYNYYNPDSSWFPHGTLRATEGTRGVARSLYGLRHIINPIVGLATAATVLNSLTAQYRKAVVKSSQASVPALTAGPSRKALMAGEPSAGPSAAAKDRRLVRTSSSPSIIAVKGQQPVPRPGPGPIIEEIPPFRQRQIVPRAVDRGDDTQSIEGPQPRPVAALRDFAVDDSQLVVSKSPSAELPPVEIDSVKEGRNPLSIESITSPPKPSTVSISEVTAAAVDPSESSLVEAVGPALNIQEMKGMRLYTNDRGVKLPMYTFDPPERNTRGERRLTSVGRQDAANKELISTLFYNLERQGYDTMYTTVAGKRILDPKGMKNWYLNGNPIPENILNKYFTRELRNYYIRNRMIAPKKKWPKLNSVRSRDAEYYKNPKGKERADPIAPDPPRLPAPNPQTSALSSFVRRMGFSG